MTQINRSLDGELWANRAMYLIILLTCLPLTMVLPSFIRMPIQIIAVLLFIIGLLLLGKYYYIWALIVLFSISGVYFIGSWGEKMRVTTFLFNSLCCWEIVIYGMLSLSKKINFNKNIIRLITIVTLVTAVTTIIGLMQYPLAVRELGRELSYSGADIKSTYRVMNIANWSQLYGMVFIAGALAYFFKETRNIITLVTIIVSEICILNAQITFAVLLSVMLLFLIFINMKSMKAYYTMMCLGIVVLGVIILALDNILSWSIEFAKQSGLSMFAYKLQDLHNLTIANAVTGDAAARFGLYTRSLNAFYEYPLGMYWQDNIHAIDYIGYHSEVFDIIGTLGILGIFIIIL